VRKNLKALFTMRNIGGDFWNSKFLTCLETILYSWIRDAKNNFGPRKRRQGKGPGRNLLPLPVSSEDPKTLQWEQP